MGLIQASDIDAPWDDLMIAVKCGLEGRKADRAKSGSKGGGGAVMTPVASQRERREAIEAARERMSKGG